MSSGSLIKTLHFFYFSIKGDHEKLNGLPITSNMDRDTFSKANSQIGFIQFLVVPLIEALVKIFPQISVSFQNFFHVDLS